MPSSKKLARRLNLSCVLQWIQHINTASVILISVNILTSSSGSTIKRKVALLRTALITLPSNFCPTTFVRIPFEFLSKANIEPMFPMYYRGVYYNAWRKATVAYLRFMAGINYCGSPSVAKSLRISTSLKLNRRNRCFPRQSVFLSSSVQWSGQWLPESEETARNAEPVPPFPKIKGEETNKSWKIPSAKANDDVKVIT